MNKNRGLSLIYCFVLIQLILNGTVNITAGDDGTIFWPAAEWELTDPAEVGMDRAKIYETYDYIENMTLPIHSISIVRDGFLIHEEYLYHSAIREEHSYGPEDISQVKDGLHVQWSLTKTITALLIGIAIDKGYIENVTQPFSSFFPELAYSSIEKENITIEHLLTMTSGIFGDADPEFWTGTWDRTIQEIVDPALYFIPGTQFRYSSYSTNLLSAIINKTSGQMVSDFAEDYLFNPIGISRDEWVWQENSEGVNYGGYGIWLTPQAMARIGLLMINNGTWNGTQVISENWIYEMGTPRSQTGGSYGYLVWMDEYYFHALGYGGQCIYLIPSQNLVVCFTAGFEIGIPTAFYTYIIDNCILAALVEDDGGFNENRTISGYLATFQSAILLGTVVAFLKIQKMKGKRNKLSRVEKD